MGRSYNPAKSHIKDILKTIFPSHQVLIKPQETAIYGSDASRIYKIPLAVVFPESPGDVQKVFKVANSFNFSVIPRGRGTNVVGGCVPVEDAIVLSTANMNRIIDINDKDFVAVVEPGVLTGDLQKEVEKRGLFYPPDPSSSPFSTIGGNVATNAGGLRAVKYGVTKDYVIGLEVVLPLGDIVTLGGRFHKNSAGLDLVRLFVGSEGVLGFFTKIFLKLIPLPERSASVIVGFENMGDGFKKVYDMFKNGIFPVALEFLDEKISSFFTEKKGIQMSVIIKVDGNREAVSCDVEKLKRLFKKALFFEVGDSDEKENEIWEKRRMLNQLSFRFGKDKLALDLAVPRGRMKELLLFLKDMERKFDIPVLAFGHIGDGNLHINIMYDKDDKDMSRRAEEMAERIYMFAINLEGTLSAEHGIGLVKLNYLKYQLSQKEIELMRKIKAIFDPNNIMNPEKAF